MINVATDGACKGNPGPGGWGYVVFDEEDEMCMGGSGGELTTTNNRMEIIALIEACKCIRDEFSGEDITIHIDSTYVLKGTTQWLRGWVQKDYKGVKNEDLWRQVADLRDVWLKCNLVWVKGHSGDKYNEAADSMANEGCSRTQEDNDGWN